MQTLEKNKDIFTYTIEETIAAGGQVTGTLNIESDAKFIWLKASRAVVGSSLETIDGLKLKIKLTDTSGGRELMSDPVILGNFAGSGSLPVILDFPREFSPNSTIRYTIFNEETATKTVQINLHGVKVWKA